MADLKRQKEEAMAKEKLLFGRAATDRDELSNFRCGKWREILANKEKETGEKSAFRFKTRTKFHEVLLEHEK